MPISRFFWKLEKQKIPNVWTRIRPWNWKLRIFGHTPWKRWDQELQKGPTYNIQKQLIPSSKGHRKCPFSQFFWKLEKRKFSNVWTKIIPWNWKLRIFGHTPWKREEQELQKGSNYNFHKFVDTPLKMGWKVPIFTILGKKIEKKCIFWTFFRHTVEKKSIQQPSSIHIKVPGTIFSLNYGPKRPQ